jgi:hypothetical protein
MHWLKRKAFEKLTKQAEQVYFGEKRWGPIEVMRIQMTGLPGCRVLSLKLRCLPQMEFIDLTIYEWPGQRPGR